MIPILVLAIIIAAMLAMDILLLRFMAGHAPRNAPALKDALRHRLLRTIVR